MRRVPDPGRGDGVLVPEGHTPGSLARIDLTGGSPPGCVGVALRPEVHPRRLGLGPPGFDRLSVPCSRIAHDSPFLRGGSGSTRFEERKPDQPTLRHFSLASKGLIPRHASDRACEGVR